MKRVLALAAVALFGCGSAEPRVHAQLARVRAERDGKEPLAGADVRVNGKPFARTSAEGMAEVRLRGIAGERFKVDLGCPEGFRPVGDESREIFVTPTIAAAPELVFRCDRQGKQALVLVRVEGGPNLPVRILGREVARTDASGAATLTLEGRTDDAFEVVIDTSSAPKLHPQNPSLTFKLGNEDGTFVFNQKFTADKPKAKPAAKPRVPVELNPRL